jgi:hypothetical protein
MSLVEISVSKVDYEKLELKICSLSNKLNAIIEFNELPATCFLGQCSGAMRDDCYRLIQTTEPDGSVELIGRIYKEDLSFHYKIYDTKYSKAILSVLQRNKIN